MRLAFLTVADRCRYHMPQFLESCERARLRPQVMGMGWPYLGLGTKPKQVYRFLRAAPSLAGWVVLFSDAHDSIIQGDAGMILERYRAFGHPLVFSAERNCYPSPELAARYPAAGTPYAYLNSGGFIGEAGYLLDLLERWDVPALPDRENDQGWFTRRFLDEPEAIRLDTHCSLFQTLYRAEGDLERRQKGIFNRVTKAYPLIFHGNGRAPMRRVFEWCRYDPEPYVNPLRK